MDNFLYLQEANCLHRGKDHVLIVHIVLLTVLPQIDSTTSNQLSKQKSLKKPKSLQGKKIMDSQVILKPT